MSLKYYLRGLGTGMAVTALIMGIALGGKETLSDEEIRERAARLGMTDGGKVLADLEESRESGQDSDSQQDSVSQKESGQENPEALNRDDGDLNTVPSGDEVQDATAPSGENQGNTSQNKESQGSISQSRENQGSTSQDQDPQASMAPDRENQETASPGRESQENKPSGQTSGQEQGESEAFTITVKPGDSSESVSRALAEAGLVEDAEEYDKYLCANGYDKKICVGSYQIVAGASGEDIAMIITKKK